MAKPDDRARWADAVAVLAVVVTVMLAARQLRPLAQAGAFLARAGEPVVPVPVSAWLRAAVWVVIGGAVLLRWRFAAALIAWMAVTLEIVVAVLRGNGGPRYALPLDLLAWPLLLAVTAALLLSASAPRRPGLELMERRGCWMLGAAVAAAALTATATPLLSEYRGALVAIPTRLADGVAAVTLAVELILVLAAVSGLDRSVQLRVYTLIATGTAAFAGIQLGLPFPFGMSTVPPLSRPAQAALLVIGPCLVFGSGLLVIRFRRGPGPADRAGRARTESA